MGYTTCRTSKPMIIILAEIDNTAVRQTKPTCHLMSLVDRDFSTTHLNMIPNAMKAIRHAGSPPST
jgi:hypothetical protein